MLNSELETNTGNVRPPRLVIIESIRRDIEKARLKNSRRISYHGWRKRESSSLAYVSSQANDLDFWGQARQEGPARGFFLLEIRALINIARYIFSRRLVPGCRQKRVRGFLGSHKEIGEWELTAYLGSIRFLSRTLLWGDDLSFTSVAHDQIFGEK